MDIQVIGLDLAGSSNRSTGFCLLNRKNVTTKILFDDKEIVNVIMSTNSRLVAIDAPLSLPKDRCCLSDDCPCKGKGHLRESDKVLLKMKIKFFPLTLGPMRMLTIRGMKIAEMLRLDGLEVIEVYPGGAQDVWGIPRKQKGEQLLRYNLRTLGICGIKKDAGHDELDAVTCALVAKAYKEGHFSAIGDPKEGLIIMPKNKKEAKL